MRNRQATCISWIALALAFVAWSVVGFFAWTLSAAASARTSESVTIGQDAVKQEASLQLRIFARETEGLRAELEANTWADAISILEAVEAAGKDAGVSIAIGQVIASPPAPTASPAAPAVRTVVLVAEAAGSFTALIQAANLLSSLSLASTVDQLHFEHSSTADPDAPATWRLIARIRVLTTAEI